ncbi:MAG TPA: GAF domain-containing protein [Sedimentibacter sp.]|jgi:GAF domain-containing protein|nr:GAF domain-containing protein [Sedimentibacter sp.]HHZ00834.1 GAF domain-containing protein [Tissierellia bacterium]HOK48980.1 GAF domain-containing protein [Sedimentibacter sp.]HOW22085.1 GAF domain-containing protein [Sedimentibacter sp.]HRC80206.1 GAF domain-containing protein [Sedimentibacter sp.]
MEEINKKEYETKEELYKDLCKTLTALIRDEEDWLANLANSSALLWMMLKDINWAGFYLYKNNELVLGPFQGKPACTRIELGKGVCGKAALAKETILVENVHEFPGYIACDSQSNSEIVVPIIKNNKLIGVLDIDSPIYSRFDETDKKYLEEFVDILNKYITYPDKFI